jgi:hypothetical protein
LLWGKANDFDEILHSIEHIRARFSTPLLSH